MGSYAGYFNEHTVPFLSQFYACVYYMMYPFLFSVSERIYTYEVRVGMRLSRVTSDMTLCAVVWSCCFTIDLTCKPPRETRVVTSSVLC